MLEMIDNVRFLQARGEHLEEINRSLLDGLDLLTCLSDFQARVNLDQAPHSVLEATRTQVKRLMAFKVTAFLLVSEADSDLVVAECEPKSHVSSLKQEIEIQIAEGTFAWALNRNRAVMVPAKHSAEIIIFHSLATKSRVMGMFVGILAHDHPNLNEISLMLLSTILTNAAYALDNAILNIRITEHSQRLEQLVQERTVELEKTLREVEAGSVALKRREAILDAIGFAAEILLSTSPWEERIQDVLARLGRAMDVSRVSIFENQLAPDGELLSSQRYEWVAPAVTAQIHNPLFQGLRWQAMGSDRWAETFQQGQAAQAQVQNLPPFERKLLEPLEIRSIAVVPIFVGKDWWGFIVFSDCEAAREWSAAEMDALHAAGRTLGAAIQRQRAEQALATTNDTLGALIAASPLPIIAGDAEGKVLIWNPAAERVFGWDEEEVRGRFNPTVPEDKLNEHLGLRQRVLAGNACTGVEVRRQRKDGSLLDVSLSTAPVRNPRGEIEGIIAVLEDITDRKRAERELEQATEVAEAANRAKSEFLAMMSHEIRTPMNGIIGMTELALETDLTTQQRDYLGMVKESADALLTLIDDILDFSRLEAGKLGLEQAEFELQDTVSKAVRALALKAHEKRLELISWVSPDLPVLLLGDPGRLRQILLNLVGNAVKFTPAGEVVLRANLESRALQGVTVHFAISDTGIGIPREKQQTIFEAFVQGDSSTTRRYGGTGLGLTIAARLVEMMSGRIWVDSEPGRGSTFHFTAQFTVPDRDVEPRRQGPIGQLHEVPILVVDDNPTVRDVISSILTDWGMRPFLAGGGKEGMEAFERAHAAGTPFSLVLLDAYTPDMECCALSAKLWEQSDKRVRIITMLSPAERRGNVSCRAEPGVVGHVMKPIRPSELLEVILGVLGKANRSSVEDTGQIEQLDLKPDRPLRVLIAEDNPVSRELVMRLLQKRGHTAVPAEDGGEVLQMLNKEATEGFDVILMDVEMPGKDGIHTTVAIREREESSGRHIPIIALTAHADESARSRCLDHGMDGYVSKPIRPAELFSAVEGVVGAHPYPGKRNLPEATPSFETAGALERVEGDRQLLLEVANVFLAGYQGLETAVQEALESRDSQALERAAHKLKGSSANFAAPTALASLNRVETLARQGDLIGAEEAWKAAQQEMARLRSDLANFVKKAAR